MPGPVRTEVTPVPPVGQGSQVDPNSTAAVSDPGSPYYNPDHPSYQPTSDSSTTTYVDLGVTSETGDEVYDDASTTVTNADATDDDGWFGDLIEDFTRGSRIRDQYEQDMAAQAQELAQGISTRPGPGMPQTNYLSYDHGTSLKPMVTQDVDPDDVGATGEMWTDTGNAMTTFQRSVAEAINRSTTEWQGAAGNSARSFMADVANWIGSAGQSAQLAGTQTSLQASALSQAKNTMPEPVPYDRQSYVDRMNGATSIDEMLTIADEAQAQYDAHQEAHTEAARVVGTYDGALRAASTMPAFGAPPTMDGDGGDPTSLPTSTTQVGSTGRSTSPPGTDTLWTPPTGPGDDGNIDDDSNNDDNGDSDGNDGNGNDEDDPGQTTPGENGGYPGYPGYPGNTGNPGGQTGTGTGSGPGYPGMPMGGPMGPGFGAGDTERGMGRPGYGGRGGFGSGAGFGGSGGANSGTGGLGPRGLGAGALAAEHAAFGGRGGSGAGGRGSAGMGGAPTGARGDGEEDGEHQRPSFLVEPDPDEVFGTDQLTAPPVIGE